MRIRLPGLRLPRLLSLVSGLLVTGPRLSGLLPWLPGLRETRLLPERRGRRADVRTSDGRRGERLPGRWCREGLPTPVTVLRLLPGRARR
ncbi:hypothetical protein [Saccharopolyspora flava]|uniref:hypothetical protein n=1 Tax=Saccharopolyspora flava TaxID=95161 RepID=UPI001114A958|nr:hypothetical protein [Saccharopolyspora flava]